MRTDSSANLSIGFYEKPLQLSDSTARIYHGPNTRYNEVGPATSSDEEECSSAVTNDTSYTIIDARLNEKVKQD